MDLAIGSETVHEINYPTFCRVYNNGDHAVLIHRRSAGTAIDEPGVPPRPRLTLTAEQEYTIREIIKDVKVAKEKSATETVGDSVPENVKLYPLPLEIERKVPQAQSHEFFVEDDDTIIVVSPSDRRIADVLKKKSVIRPVH
jgi:hypothetical protein